MNSNLDATSPNLPVEVNAEAPPTSVPVSGSPGWSAQGHPSGPVERSPADGSVFPELASLISELKADRLSRREERAESEDRLGRIEEWIGRISGGSGKDGIPGVVSVPSWYRSSGSYESGLPSRRESKSYSLPPQSALPEAGVLPHLPVPPMPNTSTRTASLTADPDLDLAPSKVVKELKEWLKTAQKVTGGAASRKFDGKYWDLWKREMTIALREAKLHKFIAADFVPPIADPNSLAYHQYVEGDPMTQRFILKHLDEERAHALSHMDSAVEMWDHLLSTEESRTINDVRRMVHDWEIMKQEPSETMQAFIRRIDLLAAQLKEVNKVRESDDKLFKLLEGMGKHWDVEKRSFEITASSQSYKEVCAILLGIAVKRGEVGSDLTAGGEAHFTVGGSNERGKPRGQFPKFPLFCFGCGSKEHHTGSCPKVTLEKLPNGKYPQNCFFCYKSGHFRRDCPERRTPGGHSH